MMLISSMALRMEQNVDMDATILEMMNICIKAMSQLCIVISIGILHTLAYYILNQQWRTSPFRSIGLETLLLNLRDQMFFILKGHAVHAKVSHCPTSDFGKIFPSINGDSIG